MQLTAVSPWAGDLGLHGGPLERKGPTHRSIQARRGLLGEPDHTRNNVSVLCSVALSCARYLSLAVWPARHVRCHETRPEKIASANAKFAAIRRASSLVRLSFNHRDSNGGHASRRFECSTRKYLRRNCPSRPCSGAPQLTHVISRSVVGPGGASTRTTS
jgi:hypothetical protein